jgi:hypothetical protein
MLNYITARNYKHLNSLINIWNGEFRHIYKIRKNIYKEKILEDENLNLDASFVALYDNQPVGFIFVKTWKSETGLVNENTSANISLIFVKKEMRNMGIGSDMLSLAILEIKKFHDIKTLTVGNELNNVFAGVPSELNTASIFFVNKEFMQKEAAVDMIRVARNDVEEEIDYKGLKVRIATEEDKDSILKLCVTNKWQREAYLLNKYYENGGTGRRIAVGIKDKDIVAFVRFNDNVKKIFKTSIFDSEKNIGAITFAKVDSKFEKEGYDVVMNKVAKNYLIKRGCKKIFVGATKNVKFFKSLGFSAFKYYLQFELPLKQEEQQ